MDEAAVPITRAWNSWESDHPATMRFLPLGLELRVCAYASSRSAFTDFPAGAPGLVLGPRGITADGVELGLAHGGTELDLRYESPDPLTLLGRYRVRKHGEWGLRFWVLLVLRLIPPDAAGAPVPWRFEAADGIAAAAHAGRHVAVGAARRPLLVTVHPSIEALREEMQSKGYWYLGSRGAVGPVMALRFNLEEMPRLGFAAVVAADSDAAAERVGSVLSASAPSRLGYRLAPQDEEAGGERTFHPHPEVAAQRPSKDEDVHLAAIRDVIAWNTVWDPVNRRPYTALSRNWGAQKFGGWGIWLDDLFFHALMASLLDADVARENLEAALSNATSYGNLACLVTGRDAWVDRSQPPIGSFVAWLLYRRLGEESLLSRAYPVLAANHAWWLKTRDGNGDGLYEYGSSEVGTGLYVGTKLAAKDESFMDNSPVHDEAEFDPKTRTLTAADVGLNSLIALDAEMLALIALRIGERDAAAGHARTAKTLSARIRTRLWDEERQVFANRLWSGKFVRSLAPTSFFPLLAGAASPEQAKAMARLLDDTTKFGGAWLLPSVTRDDPAFADNVYWRGRIWPPLNFLVWAGLRRAGFLAEAAALAENGWRLFQRAWALRKCPENYSAVTGEAFDQPDTDDFYGWGALMPFLALGERIDVSPWEGWTLARGPAGERLGPVCSPWGALTLSSEEGAMSLELDGRLRFATSVERLSALEFDGETLRALLPPGPAGVWVAAPLDAARSGHLAGTPLAGRVDGDRILFTLPERGSLKQLELSP
ncbi:MAG: glycoside hydrolase family 37 [Rhodospirillales bacterium]|nr:glycoside hydrolase family 37 [Rhodospirillales bacterium]